MVERKVLAVIKTPTTADVTGGTCPRPRPRCSGRPRRVGRPRGHDRDDALHEWSWSGRRLQPTAAVRLGLPATEALPPMVDWPERLRRALGGHVYLCHGGHEFDGRDLAVRPRRAAPGRRGHRRQGDPLDRRFPAFAGRPGLRAGGGGDPREALPGVAVSLSHEIGRTGLLERENATIMNGCLRDLATQIVEAFHGARRAELDAPSTSRRTTARS